MADISVRKIDERVYERLKARAASHGISMEEEVRRIVRRAVSAPGKMGDLAIRIFGPSHGIDLDLPSRESREPLDFGR